MANANAVQRRRASSSSSGAAALRASLLKRDKQAAKEGATASTSLPLLTFADVSGDPALAYLADSDYILTGYRHRPGCCAALGSFFTLHNETANIWTHLLGAGVVCRLMWCVAFAPASVGLTAGAGCTPAPVWPVLTFLCGAALCLLLSVLYHGLFTASAAWDALLNKLDYIGISALIFTSNVPPMYYAFSQRHPATGLGYIGFSLLVNAVAGVMGTVPFFRASAWRHLGALAYIVCGATGAIPLLHFMWLSSGAGSAGEWALAWQLFWRTLLMGAQYIVGAALFGLRIPERFSPGSFDFFPSHAFFHILVVTAVLTHWGSVQQLWVERSRC